MRKMVVFTMTSGRRMAISAFDVKRVIQHEIRADRVCVVITRFWHTAAGTSTPMTPLSVTTTWGSKSLLRLPGTIILTSCTKSK